MVVMYADGPPDTDMVGEAVGALQDQRLTLLERVVYGAARGIQAAIGSDLAPAWTEPELAAAAGVSRHQARQAVAGLRRAGLVLREWRQEGEDRPVPVYTLERWEP